MIDFNKYIKRPPRKDVDDMTNCHFRTLYNCTPYEDNYTDPDFLSAMQLNTNLNYYTLGEAIDATSRVALHLCVCILYFIMYYHLGQDRVTPNQVYLVSFSCIVVGYIVLQMWRFWNENWNMETFKKIPLLSDSMVSIACGSFSYLFVPILRTVTTTMDIDSVHAVCTVLFGVHLLCNNYGITAFCVSQPLSMNSAIFSMICLASRLQSDQHCLALLSFGVLSFICFPQFSEMLWDWHLGAFTLIALTTIASYTVSSWLALFVIALMFMVVAMSPFLYVHYVQYKSNILGPWDEAKPDLNINMENLRHSFDFSKKNPATEAAVVL